MSTEYINNNLSGSSISVVNLNSNLNGDRIRSLPNVQNIDNNLKHSVPVLQLNSVSDGNVNSSNTNIQNTDKRLPEEYITFPLGSDGKYSVNYICRLCAAVVDINSAISIFPSHEFEENLAIKINKYLPIIVYESDPFPKTACKSCVTKLNQFHEMVQKCVLVEDQIRQTYMYDGRYMNEFMKKINPKSEIEIFKHEPENTEQMYSMSDFHYIDSLGVNHLGDNSVKHNIEGEKKESLDKEENFTLDKSQVCSLQEQENIQNIPLINCRFCGECIKELNNCLEHSSNHTDSISSNQILCPVCTVSFESKFDLESHAKFHFDRNGVEMKTGRESHLRDKAKSRQLKILQRKSKIYNKITSCKKCKESLDSVDMAMEHCFKHRPANIKSYPCVLCVRRIGKSKLKDHVSLHFPMINKPLLSCDSCNNLYPDEKTLKYHRCTKLRKYKCSQCKQGFKSEDRLKFHEDFHKSKSTFCDICKKDFKFESRIYLHFAGVHNGIREKPYCCDVCGKTFTWLTVLNSHKRTHTNERPFKCSKCDARFCSKYSLNGHMPSHEDHPQFYCDKCDYHTGRKQNLQKHVSRFHKEINSSQVCVTCQVCNEVFPNKHHAEVENHLSKHSEVNSTLVGFSREPEMFQELVATKLYQCERCERCYVSADHLAEHRRKHATGDPSSFYQCRLCNYGFPKHDLLVKHQKIHVNVTSQYTGKLSVLTVISCDICEIECVDYRQLLNHKDRGNCMMKKISGTVRPKKVLIKKHLKPLKTHQLYVNSNGLFECPTCQRTYKNRRRYRLHLATHSSISF